MKVTDDSSRLLHMGDAQVDYQDYVVVNIHGTILQCAPLLTVPPAAASPTNSLVHQYIIQYNIKKKV